MAQIRHSLPTRPTWVVKVPWGVRLAHFVGVEKPLAMAPESRTMELMEL